MAKDRRPGAGSSTLARASLVLLVGGLGCAVLPGVSLSPIITIAALTAAFALLGVAHKQSLARVTAANDDLSLLRQTTVAEAHFRSMISEAAEVFMVVNKSGTILEFKQQDISTTGYRAEELIGTRLVDKLVTPHQRDNAIADFAQLWNDPQTLSGKYVNRVFAHRDGKELHFGITAWLDVDSSGSQARMNMVIRDESSRIALTRAANKAIAAEHEAQLRLEEVNNVKNQFVSSISHELRSPLTSTLGYLELLMDGDVGELSGQQAHMVEVAARNARRLRTLIEDILTLSKIESGAFSVQFRPVDITGAVLDVVEHHTAFARERSVNFSVLGHVNAGFVAGDRQQIVRALDNIVGNAIKFTPPSGSVDIEVKTSGESVAFVIKDTGIGIPAEEQQGLFNRFYRASAAVSQQHQGAGLGLTIAKAIVEHHGGTISIWSDETKGTEVTIELPALSLPKNHDSKNQDSESQASVAGQGVVDNELNG